jgi:hypothetical protein
MSLEIVEYFDLIELDWCSLNLSVSIPSTKKLVVCVHNT